MRQERSLDPENWEEFRRLCHDAVDDAIGFLRDVRDRPVWRPMPGEVRQRLCQDAPPLPGDLRDVYNEFRELILPYATGNIHPRFWGWVHGTGTATGLLEGILAAALNANCGGRDHVGVYLERCVLHWWKRLFGFPQDASGLMTSGTSMANLIALAVARNAKCKTDLRANGFEAPNTLVAYASTEAHESVTKSLELLGLGARSLRRIRTDTQYRIDLNDLREAIGNDRRAGLEPFCVIGLAGTVNTGAVDDLAGLSAICREEHLWLHVDAAFGGLCILHDALRPRLHGIESADSVAFDFHKWMHVQYAAGCVLIRDHEVHRKTFLARAHYLSGTARGLAGGGEWPCDLGPELSRPFYALRVWFAVREHGTRRLGEMVMQNCIQAEYLKSLIAGHPELEFVAGDLNIVCFRYRAAGLSRSETDALNRDIVADIQESGTAAPSMTQLNGVSVIRVAITNHRSRQEDFDVLVDAVMQSAEKYAPERKRGRS